MVMERKNTYTGIRGLQTRRDTILRTAEIDEMIQQVGNGETYAGSYIPKKVVRRDKATIEAERFEVPAKMVKCLLALLWLFGKRKIETLLLKRRDMLWDDRFITIRFQVKKKKEESYAGGVRVDYVKRMTMENPYVQHIITWVKDLPADAYVFPGETRGTRKRTVYRKWIKKKTGEAVEKIYPYNDGEEGHLSCEMAWKIVKSLNPEAWVHLFRRSLATQLAESGCTESELMSWFDWENANTAQGYVSKGPKLTEKISKRLW